jgi:hypothetical protein
MNRCHALGHLALIVAGLAGAAVAFAAVPAALASASPRRARLLSWADPPLPPGWNKHPRLPDPARVHAALAGGIPGWQLTLMAVTIVLLVATLVAIANPGPGRTPADERTTGDLADEWQAPESGPRGEPLYVTHTPRERAKRIRSGWPLIFAAYPLRRADQVRPS